MCGGAEWGRGCCFFKDTATTEIYTLSLHDALPIYTYSTPVTGHVNYTADPGLVDLKSVEQAHILKMLEMTNGNKSEAAKRLDIGLATLYRKLKEYNISS